MSPAVKIVIIGNGFGGVYTLQNLHKIFHHHKKIEITLIGEQNYFLFTPLLHEVATGGINPANIIEPIRKLFKCCLHGFYLGKAEIVNLKDRTVKTGEHYIPYDYLVLAPGAETNFYDIPGAEQHSFPLKSIGDAIRIKNHCVTQMERASHIEEKMERKKMLKFIVIGGGPTGVELTAELEEFIKETFSHYYSKEIVEDVSIVLIQKGKELVPMFQPKIRQKSLDVLRKKGIEVMLDSEVKEVSNSYLVLDDNTKIFTETVIWVAGVKPFPVEFNQIVEKVPDGRLIVNEYLQLKNHREVFALGDVALFTEKKNGNSNTPLPALAQVAEKESATIAKNIELMIKNKKLRQFIYHDWGNLMSLGQWMAVGEISNFTFSGHVAWWIWRTVYLSKLISFRKKIRVAVDWTMNIFSPRDISRL